MAALLFHNPFLFLLLTGPLLYSVILHEVAHGVVALAFGDDTAKRHGRLTLHPLSHLDPIGSLMLLLIGFGWAKPVPVDFGRLRNNRTAVISVALAGCVTNVLLAAVSVYLLQSGRTAGHPVLSALLQVTARVNILLGAFNLIPIPPLDGSRVLMSLLPQEGRRSLARIEPYGLGILLLLFMTGLLEPVIAGMQKLVFSLIAFLM